MQTVPDGRTPRKFAVPALWLATADPHPHVFLAKAQARCEAFYTRRADGWLYAGRARTRHRERGVLHDRQPKIPRAAAIARVLGWAISKMDVRNLQVIDYRKADGVSIAQAVQATGLSHDACKGALADLRSCGYLGSHQVRKRNADGFFPRARRWFTPKFFRQLGLWRALIATRKILGLAPPKEPRVIGTVANFVNQVAARISPWPARE